MLPLVVVGVKAINVPSQCIQRSRDNLAPFQVHPLVVIKVKATTDMLSV